MLNLSTKVYNVEESQTLAITAKAKRMKDAGVDVVSLTAGEPDFPTPQHVKDAAIKAIESNFTKYTANVGTNELIEAIIRKFSHEDNLHFGHNQIVVSSGAKQCIYNVLQAICNKGDQVAILSPYWVSYPEMVKLADAKPVVIPTGIENGFKPDIKALHRAVNANTKALILNSPNNPSGVVYSRSELEEIGEIIREKNIFVISDEIYEKVVYDQNTHFSIGSIKEIRDQVITVNGVSKAFSMTGWRIGYSGGPLAVMQAAAKVQSQVTSNANSIAQKAALAALTGSTDARDAMVREFKIRRDFVHGCLSALPDVRVVLPGGAFYFLFDVSAYYAKKHGNTFIHNSADMGSYLLEQHLVGTVPGLAFGDDNCLRISYACSMQELQKGMQRITTGLTALH